MQAANDLAADNVGLAHRFARRSHWTGIEHDELLSVCLAGLLHASRTHKPERSRFSTWAYMVMGTRVRHHVQSGHCDCREVQNHTHQWPQYPDGTPKVAPDTRRDERGTIDASDAVRFALDKLDDRMRFVLEARYLSPEPMTLGLVGGLLGMSKEGARQIEVRALAECRRLIEAS
jgi:RNA polymerase sigma factor (sigma-70 family)